MGNIQLETEAQKVESDYDDDQFEEEDAGEGEVSQVSARKEVKTEIIAEQVDINENGLLDTLDQQKEGPVEETNNPVKEE